MNKDVFREFQKGSYKRIRKNSYKFKENKKIGCISPKSMVVIVVFIVIGGIIFNAHRKKSNDNKFAISNVWVVNAEEENIKFISDGKENEYKLSSRLENRIENVIADIYIKNGKVIKIIKKPDSISGKLISIDEEYVEINEYGRVAIAENCNYYDKDNKLIIRKKTDVEVGLENIEYVLEGKKICAIICGNVANVSNDKIRVLIKNSDYSKIIHENVSINSNSKIIVKKRKNNQNTAIETLESIEKNGEVNKIDYETYYIEPGNNFALTKENLKEYISGERIVLETEIKENGMCIDSIERSEKGLIYNGKIEILVEDEGFIIINETDIEDYLCKVVPSEMPQSFGLEALKAQAVCARTYAYKHLNDEKYKKYGANVDDSTSYQVYNNQPTNEIATQAVALTKGKILKYNNEIINAYYYSTSCGLTSTDSQTFGGDKASEYLPVKYQNEKGTLTEEFVIEEFLTNNDTDCYENNCPWFRWNVDIGKEDLSKTVNKYLDINCKKKIDDILVKEKDIFISKEISYIGKVQELEVAKRESSGLVTELIIKGSKHTIKVCNQNRIRHILAPIYDDVIKKDGSVSKEMSILPSGYFVIQNNEDSIKINGGGFGHGTGMSQYGAKTMAEKGLNYEQILIHYFNGVTLFML